MKLRSLLGAALFSLVSVQAIASDQYKVLLQESAKLPVTTFNITFRTGSADDPKGKEGLAALTAGLMREGGVKAWKGLPARSREQLEEVLFPLSADIGVSVGKEQISFRVTTAAKESERVFDLLAQMIVKPAFDEKEFARISGETIDALEKQLPREDQEELGKAALDAVLYGQGHPYSHSVMGTLSGVRAINGAALQTFHQSLFTKRRLLVGVAGVVSPVLKKKIQTAFVELSAGESAKAVVAKGILPRELKLTIVRGPFDSTGVHLGNPLDVRRGDKDFPSLYLASMAFGKHRSFVGRLMSVVREERGLNYGDYSYVEDFPQGGGRLTEPTQAARAEQAFTVWARPTTLENGCFLLKQIHREVSSLAHEGLTKIEFDLGKSHLIGSAPLLATGIERRLGYEIDSQFYGIKADYLKWLVGEVKKSSYSQVNAAIKKHIKPEQMHIVVVTPDPDKFKAALVGERCTIQYQPGITKSDLVKAEDEKIATYKLPLKPENITVVDSESFFK